MTMLSALLFITAFGYAATIPVFRWYWMPPGARAALTLMASLSFVSLAGCALAIPLGGSFVFDAGTWAVMFAGVNGGSLWLFLAALVLDIAKNRR